MDLVKSYDDLVEIYEDKLDTLEKEIDINNMKLNEALKSQLQLQLDWEMLSKQVNYLFDYSEAEVESTYSNAIEVEMKNQQRMCTISEARDYARANKDYKQAKRIMIKIKQLRDECKGILEVIHSRKYILNNMTNALVSGVNDMIL